MATDLGFQIVRTPYPERSGLTGTVVQKIRDDGRVGPVVGDEALLWDAREEAVRELRDTLHQHALELERRLKVEEELRELKGQVEAKGGKKR